VSARHPSPLGQGGARARCTGPDDDGRFGDASGTVDFEAVLGDRGHVEFVFDGSTWY
jgi:hypothetical protein